jgi:carboxypeptidase PM20D1
MRGGAMALMLVLTAVIAGKSALTRSAQLDVEPIAPGRIDDRALERLAGAVRIRTVSVDDQPDVSGPAFLAFHSYLAQQFPLTHKVMRKEVINRYSLLLTWQGAHPELPPIILMAHQDVVPISPGTESQWLHDPFGGDIAEGHVWGRGAWDDKGNLMAMLEAAEHLLAQGVQPARTVYFAFGHDEEMGAQGGQRGAQAIAALLRSRKVQARFVLDEGLPITQGAVKGIDKPVALVGIAEKGYLTVKLSAEGVAGHSSSPPHQMAIGSMSQALAQLQAHPMPSKLTDATEAMFATLAPEFNVFNRVLLSNLWLTGPLVRAQIGKQASGDAMLRTTMALTTFQSGDKENALPGVATASVNLRLLPGDSVGSAFAHVAQIAQASGVKAMRKEPSWEASRVSDVSSPSYVQFHRTIREVFPDAIVAPGLMIGATDSRYMEPVAKQVYRFTPIMAAPQDLARFHGTNERVSVEGYRNMIAFYGRLLQGVAAADQD